MLEIMNRRNRFKSDKEVVRGRLHLLELPNGNRLLFVRDTPKRKD